MTVTLSDALRQAAGRLREAGIENAMGDARVLVAAAAGLSREDMLRDPHLDLAADRASAFADMVERRAAREPVSRILGVREFHSLTFALGPDTLDPRPDSETVVEAALAWAAGRDAPLHILDVGTGTGCLLLSLLHDLPRATGVGTDISAGAVATAEENARRLGLADRARFAVCDWTDGVDGPFDLVISNPPYIADEELARLEPEVAEYDPRAALSGGVDGLAAYRALAACLRPLMARGGRVFLEIGATQAEDVKAVFEAADFVFAGMETDLAGRARSLAFHAGPYRDVNHSAQKKGLETG